MWLLISGLLTFLLPGGWAFRRAKHELVERGRIGPETFIVAFAAYTLHAGVTLFAAWKGEWPLPIPSSVALTCGGILGVIGALIYAAGRWQFGSFRLTWGLETSRLVTTGIYRYTRNPQTIGSLLFLAGAGILGKSGVALLLVLVPWLASRIWIPVEETMLDRKFGEDYTRYRGEVPRYLSIPRRKFL